MSLSKKAAESGGYVGLMAMLIIVAIIGLWLYYYSPLGTLESNDEYQSTRTRGLEAIEEAKKAKESIESHTKEMQGI